MDFLDLISASSQWQNLLHHLGVWQGVFTRLSAEGVLLEDMPTVVTLAGLHDNQTVRQTNQYFAAATGALEQEKVLEYSTLGRGTLVFGTGAFSQGSLQYSPLAEFGAEMVFVSGDRRLRLVQLFQPGGNLSRLTLIREQRQGSSAPERPPVTLDQLLGEWRGEAATLYSDWRSPDVYPISLTLQQQGDRLQQQLITPQFSFASTAAIAGQRLLFDQSESTIQVLLLPDGASASMPLTIPQRRPFLLEAGWLVEPNLRHRLIRSYDAQGGWVSLTLVIERREQPSDAR